MSIAIVVAFLAPAAWGSGELIDPTRPPNVMPGRVEDPERETPWLLSAIFVAKGRRIAIVNGRPVRTGEIVDGAIVKQIAHARVVLATTEGEVDLPLVEASVKRTEAHPK